MPALSAVTVELNEITDAVWPQLLIPTPTVVTVGKPFVITVGAPEIHVTTTDLVLVCAEQVPTDISPTLAV